MKEKNLLTNKNQIFKKSMPNKKTISIIIIFILAILILTGILWIGKETRNKQEAKIKQQQLEKQQQEEERKKQEQIQQEENGNIDTSQWKTYRNEEFGFEMKYPSDWEIDSKTVTKKEFASIKSINIGYIDEKMKNTGGDDRVDFQAFYINFSLEHIAGYIAIVPRSLVDGKEIEPIYCDDIKNRKFPCMDKSFLKSIKIDNHKARLFKFNEDGINWNPDNFQWKVKGNSCSDVVVFMEDVPKNWHPYNYINFYCQNFNPSSYYNSDVYFKLILESIRFF